MFAMQLCEFPRCFRTWYDPWRLHISIISSIVYNVVISMNFKLLDKFGFVVKHFRHCVSWFYPFGSTNPNRPSVACRRVGTGYCSKIWRIQNSSWTILERRSHRQRRLDHFVWKLMLRKKHHCENACLWGRCGPHLVGTMTLDGREESQVDGSSEPNIEDNDQHWQHYINMRMIKW